MIGRIFRQGIDDLLNLLRAEGSIGQHDLLHIDGGGLWHRQGLQGTAKQ